MSHHESSVDQVASPLAADLHQRRRAWSTPAAVLLALLALLVGLSPLGPVQASTHQPTTGRSAGSLERLWLGHTRTLRIRDSGRAREIVYSGCCDETAEIAFQVLRTHGTTHRGFVVARLVRVRYWEPFDSAPRPRPGRVARFVVRRGVLGEPVVHTIYCTQAAGADGTCGA